MWGAAADVPKKGTVTIRRPLSTRVNRSDVRFHAAVERRAAAAETPPSNWKCPGRTRPHRRKTARGAADAEQIAPTEMTLTGEPPASPGPRCSAWRFVVVPLVPWRRERLRSAARHSATERG